jgi:hypothetical protein
MTLRQRAKHLPVGNYVMQLMYSKGEEDKNIADGIVISFTYIHINRIKFEQYGKVGDILEKAM